MTRFVKLYPNGVGSARSIEVNADAVLWIDEPYDGLQRCRLHMLGGETVDLANQWAFQVGYALNDPVSVR